MTTTTPTTRLAPSPTGALHLGNARTFLINWALAVQNNWHIVLRIDDLDTPRTKSGADQQAIEDLTWLGMNWHTGPVYQSDDLAPYHDALTALAARALIYPCTATRNEILAAASAPHSDEHEIHYPAINRPPSPAPFTFKPVTDQNTAYRLIVPDTPTPFTDTRLGPQSVNVQQQVGDFVVAAKSGLPAYQLATVVDDARQNITHIVRGDDLLRSTARQLILYHALNLQPIPTYTHLPLVLGPDGRRLAKRHGDTRIAFYRDRGVPPQRLLGLLAEYCGIGPRAPLTPQDFASRFDIAKLPTDPITFTDRDHRWLCDE